jgi:hypothetical protein
LGSRTTHGDIDACFPIQKATVSSEFSPFQSSGRGASDIAILVTSTLLPSIVALAVIEGVGYELL